MKVIGDDSQTLDIEINDIVRFGTEVEKVYNKGNKKFRSFHSKTWVEDKDHNRYYTDKGIRSIKSLFDNYSSDKIIIEHYKDNKVVKATEWDCEVLIDGVEKIPKQFRHKVYDAVKNKKHFSLDGHHMFFRIFWNVYKNSQSDEYVFVNTDKHELIRIDMSFRGKNEEDVKKYIEEYILND